MLTVSGWRGGSGEHQVKGQGRAGGPPAEAGRTSLVSGGLTTAGGVVFREVMENRSGLNRGRWCHAY